MVQTTASNPLLNKKYGKNIGIYLTKDLIEMHCQFKLLDCVNLSINHRINCHIIKKSLISSIINFKKQKEKKSGCK